MRKDLFKGIILTLLSYVLFTLLIVPVSAGTLQGTIYNEKLEVEKDVLLEIDTVPMQKFLSKEGTYSFELKQGTYTLSARKGYISSAENIEIREESTEEGTYTFDFFLFPGFVDEDDLWQDTEEEFFTGEEIAADGYEWWRYAIAGAIVIFALWRFLRLKKRHGSLRAFRQKIKNEMFKSTKQHKEELANEPGYIETALEIIRKHEGRITQKELRKEMLYLSEAKVSLIVTELEHKGKIEKVKKGRGNVILLKG